MHRNTYGLAGKRWIEFLFEHKPVWSSLQDTYEETVEALDSQLKYLSYDDIDKDTMRDQNRLLGAVELTLYLINDCFGFEFPVDKVITDIKQMVYGEIEGNSKPMVALKKIIMWAVINEDAHFTLHTKSGKRHGFVRANKYIGIFENSVEYFLKENGFNFSVMDEWTSMGIRMFEKDGRDYRVSIDPKNRHEMVTFKWSELNKYLGEGFYQQEE